MSGQNGYRCPYCKDRFETQQRLDEHAPCPSNAGDVVDRTQKASTDK